MSELCESAEARRERQIMSRCTDKVIGKIHRGELAYPTGSLDEMMVAFAALIAAERPHEEAEYDLYHTSLYDLTQRQLMERLRRARLDVINARLNIAWTLEYAGQHYRNENEHYGAYYEGVAEGHQMDQQAAEEDLKEVVIERERRRAYRAVNAIVSAAYGDQEGDDD